MKTLRLSGCVGIMHWEKIVEEHGPLVWRTAFRLLGQEADAADCYQEAFAAALVIARKENVRNWGGLLRKLTTVQALDRLRRRFKERARQGAAAELETVPSGDIGPSQMAEGKEAAEWFRRALAELPEMQARALWMTCVEELTYQEAAAELEIEAGHVGVLVHRARARLREMLMVVTDFQNS